MITFLHSGDMGDLIAGLATVKSVCREYHGACRFLVDTSGGLYNEFIRRQSGGKGLKLHKAQFEFLKPLLKAQYYIAYLDEWDGKEHIDFDLNDFRAAFFSREGLSATNQNLMFAHQYAFGLPMGYTEPWMTLPDEIEIKRDLLVARSNRYHSSDQLFLLHKRFFDNPDNGFIGTDLEYDSFLDCVPSDLKRIPISNALEAAQEIMASKRFLVNGTLFYWIAVALGHKDIQHELAVDIPTTLFTPGKPEITYWQGMHIMEITYDEKTKNDNKNAT